MLSERGTNDSEKWSQERAQPEEIEVEGKNSWSYKFLELILYQFVLFLRLNLIGIKLMLS